MDLDYLKSKQILLVDDEADLLNMVISILRDDGYENIRTAKTVGEALSQARAMTPELAVLDVMLPDGNGLELMKELRTLGDFPVLFLSARGEDEDLSLIHI